MKNNAMRLDFSEAPLKNRVFSEKPMSFIEEAPKILLSAIIELRRLRQEIGSRVSTGNVQRESRGKG